MTQQEIRDQLKKLGLRATAARVAVLYVLKHSDRPLSHSEMVQELQDVYGDQATIYRTLITFVDVGLIRIASNVGGMTRYEFLDADHDSQHVHPHFVCTDCGIVSCLPRTTVINSVDEQWREILRASELQFLGNCLECTKK
jgi:Fur family ferric uptake transcriptional regulator